MTARVLDIGCADGATIGYRLAGLGFCVGIDFDVRLIRKAVAAGIADAAFLAASAQALPFPDGAFDTVNCEHVIEHVPDLGEALAEAARVLAPGGNLKLSFPDGRAERIIASMYPEYFSPRFHRRIIDVERLRNALAGHGLIVSRVSRNQSFRALKNIYKFASGHQIEDQTGRPVNRSFVLKALESLWVVLEFTPEQIDWHLKQRDRPGLRPVIRVCRVLSWPLRPVFLLLNRVIAANVDVIAVKEPRRS